VTAIEDRLRDRRRSISPPDLLTADQLAPRGPRRRHKRRTVRVLSGLTLFGVGAARIGATQPPSPSAGPTTAPPSRSSETWALLLSH
jgi:hypothetical protein